MSSERHCYDLLVVRDAATLTIDSPWPSTVPAPLGLPAPAAGAGPEAGEVTVWLIDLDRPPLPAERLAAHLSPDERRRADRFRFDVHRRRFATGRGALRELLGRLLDRDPAGLSFAYGEKGKPRLVEGAAGVGPAGAGLRFNLSHSQNAALIAVARGREVGVDVEALRSIDDAPLLVERFFARRERRVFAGLGEAERLAGFYTAWTRKEAYVKARGDGLSLPTTAFEVTLAPGSEARLIAFEQEPAEVDRWALIGLDPAPGFLGAVAVEGRVAKPVCRAWRP